MSGGFSSGGGGGARGGGCVIGPGENPMRPGEVAVLLNKCMSQKTRVACKLPPLYERTLMTVWGIYTTEPDNGLDIMGGFRWGLLCKFHEVDAAIDLDSYKRAVRSR